MKVILFQDVPGLGRKNDVKDVSDGYARNFLFAKNLAKPANETALKSLAEQKSRVEKEKSAESQKFSVIVEKLKSLNLIFPVKLGEKGRAFGSVTAVKIRDSLKKQGIAVEKDWIILDEPIKTTGENMVKIKFPQGMEGEVRILVEAE
ncbi:MAG: 50S ribosomal protein L9 [Candidatus Sungbacteria bacterium]|nr:50S ribosomal protein L9 [Candidatus Sungbacteria bacterium]